MTNQRSQPGARSAAAERVLDDEAAPWNAPQSTNVHAAPCQRPPSSIVIIRLRYVNQRPPRLPPSGM